MRVLSVLVAGLVAGGANAAPNFDAAAIAQAAESAASSTEAALLQNAFTRPEDDPLLVVPGLVKPHESLFEMGSISVSLTNAEWRNLRELYVGLTPSTSQADIVDALFENSGGESLDRVRLHSSFGWTWPSELPTTSEAHVIHNPPPPPLSDSAPQATHTAGALCPGGYSLTSVTFTTSESADVLAAWRAYESQFTGAYTPQGTACATSGASLIDAATDPSFAVRVANGWVMLRQYAAPSPRSPPRWKEWYAVLPTTNGMGSVRTGVANVTFQCIDGCPADPLTILKPLADGDPWAIAMTAGLLGVGILVGSLAVITARRYGRSPGAEVLASEKPKPNKMTESKNQARAQVRAPYSQTVRDTADREQAKAGAAHAHVRVQTRVSRALPKIRI